MILNDMQIESKCGSWHLNHTTGKQEWTPSSKPMIEPFFATQVRHQDETLISEHGTHNIKKAVLSYGLSSFGYDVRLGNKFKIFNSVIVDHTPLIDPKKPDHGYFIEREGDFAIIPPNSFLLGHTIERINVPRNVMVLCLGKSTYARLGLIVNVTPLEPEWVGQVTLEISNTTQLPAKVYAGEGIAQFLFLQGDAPRVSYADRKGKYQGQQGVTPARI